MNLAQSNFDLFLATAPEDSRRAVELLQPLQTAGLSVWHRPIESGGQADGLALDALRQASAVLLLFSAAAANDRTIDRTLLVARQMGKPLIPVRLQSVDEGLLRQELLDAEWIEAADRAGLAAAIVSRFYRLKLVPRPQPQPWVPTRQMPVLAVAPPTQETRGSANVALISLLGIFCVALVALIVFLLLRSSGSLPAKEEEAMRNPASSVRMDSFAPLATSSKRDRLNATSTTSGGMSAAK